MSARRYYFGAEQRYNTSGYVDRDCQDDEPLYPCNNKDSSNNKSVLANNEPQPEPEPEADKDDDSEFLQDVPYSSSSIDRSSIGSIPWADDAIKKNKQDWERVDRMLAGREPLPDEEPELHREIADWQLKFPILMARKAQPLKQQSFDQCHRHTVPDDTADIESLSDLSLNSDDFAEGDEEDDGFLTPTAENQRQRKPELNRPSASNYLRSTQNLVTILDRDLHITSVALKLRKREHAQQPSAPSTPQSATVARSRLRMPPILNVLDSNRRFRGLLNNRSFVQLTQVQHQNQPKSAALTYASSAERRQEAGVRSAWHMPMAANRFLNNKHAIVLPALNRHRDFTATATTSSQSNSSGGGAHNSNSSLSSSRRGAVYNVSHQQQFGLPLGHLTTNSNTPSTGRSISAAIHHPRSQFATNSAFYIPYSASKFKAFK